VASLKNNVQIIHDGLVKNIGIVLGQAREKARAAAFEYMQHRNGQLSDVKNQEYENTEAVIAWLTKLESVVKEVPEIHDDAEPAPVEEFSEHQ
jgi:hypothetical protein